MSPEMDTQKERAATWFRQLRDDICAAFEALEDQATEGPWSDRAPGRFERTPTSRDGGGGGEMSVMKGRCFEKVGVNISAVHGQLAPAAQKALTSRKEIPGLESDPRFWAAGISLVAHMWNPMVPAVHMNTRMFWTPGGWWFGGGSDLNPMIPFEDDTGFFHKVLEDSCAPHSPDYYPRFKAWADEYFMIKHWKEPRGVGGIFYDDLNTGDWEADFAFTQDVGRAFIDAFVPLVAKRMNDPFTEADVRQQMFRRGRYAEFNLVYDRGTTFGLQTGHNPQAVLMSLPPRAEWP